MSERLKPTDIPRKDIPNVSKSPKTDGGESKSQKSDGLAKACEAPSDSKERERSEGECSTSSLESLPPPNLLPTEIRKENINLPTACFNIKFDHAQEQPFTEAKKGESSLVPELSSDDDGTDMEIDTSFSEDLEETIETESSPKTKQDNENSQKSNTKSSKVSGKSDSEELLFLDKAKVASETEVEDQFINKLRDQLSVEFKVTLPSVKNLVTGHSQFLRMPNFIPVDPTPYDAQTYSNHMSVEDMKSEQCREYFISRLKTTIRWRERRNDLGELKKESNARIVRWSDGSETFHVGAEVFDIMHHPVTDDQNQLYVRLDNFYQAQTSIKDKMTLRPKLDSTFGQSHMQVLRNRAQPQTGCVKVLMDLGTNPVVERERKIKEALARIKKEEREKRRLQQLKIKPHIKPMRHCTADDSDLDESRDKDIAHSSTMSPNEPRERKHQDIDTNRNITIKPSKLEDSDMEVDDEDDDEDDDDDDDDEDDGDEEDGSDINDIINDNDSDSEDDANSYDEIRKKKAQKRKKEKEHDSGSDSSDVGRSFKRFQRKSVPFKYSDSDD